jgi:hypothetical protein
LFSKSAVESTLAQIDLEEFNRAFVEYWLSLWSGDALPSRSQLNPAKMKRFLRNLLILDVKPHAQVTVRLAGTAITGALEMELAGKDWIALAPEHYRAERLRILSDIAAGALGVGYRRLDLIHNQELVCEEVILPFAAETSGNSPVVVHFNAQTRRLPLQSSAQAVGDPLDFKVIKFPRMEAEHYA